MYEWLGWRVTKKVEDAQRRELGLPKATGPAPRRIAERGSLEIQAYDEVCFPGLAAEWAKWDGQRPFVGALTMELPTDADEEVASWIAAGTPPIFFGFGSMPVESPADTVAMISAACAQLGERALVCSGWSDFSDVPHFDHVKVVGAVNYAAVFPACRAVVHHGGAGTTAAGLRAGVPTLILSTDLDQTLWGARVKRLKVGTARRFSTTTRESLVADLRTDPRPAIRHPSPRDRHPDDQTRRKRCGRRRSGGRFRPPEVMCSLHRRLSSVFARISPQPNWRWAPVGLDFRDSYDMKCLSCKENIRNARAAGPQRVNRRRARGRPAPRLPVPKPGVFDRQVILVKVDQGVADDDRAAVGGAEQAVRSAYCPPPALVAAVSAAMPGSLTAVDLGGEQAVASSRWPDRQIGTTECGSGIGPSTSTLAPVSRSCCTRRVKLSIHARSYDVKLPGSRSRDRTAATCSPRPAAGARRVTGR